ncbi:hypothetical protein GALL_363400 [mine drainage metagenome]|uniref:Lipoprotein n=1 Tax=mine drainage metagenome TaxID=410659 RepID=A0A1J5R157_9ZZZZ
MMQPRLPRLALTLSALALLGACEQPTDPQAELQKAMTAQTKQAMAAGLGVSNSTVPRKSADFHPVYLGIKTVLLEGDLVDFVVSMKGARSKADVGAYAACAAAQYALIRGYGFARHVRTNVAEEGGIWRGDAVYTISSALPDGLLTIDAEVTVRDCGAQGIPTI